MSLAATYNIWANHPVLAPNNNILWPHQLILYPIISFQIIIKNLFTLILNKFRVGQRFLLIWFGGRFIGGCNLIFSLLIFIIEAWFEEIYLVYSGIVARCHLASSVFVLLINQRFQTHRFLAWGLRFRRICLLNFIG